MLTACDKNTVLRLCFIPVYSGAQLVWWRSVCLTVFCWSVERVHTVLEKCLKVLEKSLNVELQCLKNSSSLQALNASC